MKKRLLFGLLGLVLVFNLAVGLQVYLNAAQTGSSKDDPYANYALLSRVMEMVRQDYVDGEKITYQDLIFGALRGMISTLDPHSEFMEPQKFTSLKEDTEGAFGGVGIVIQMKDGFVTVVAPMEDTPGFKAGIITGDRIVKIDGKSTEKTSLSDTVKKLRGMPDTEVTITIFRPSQNTFKDYKLMRAAIKVGTVKDVNNHSEFPVNEDKIGYIRLTQFGEQTAADLETALVKLEKAGMHSLVLDLRGNPGGLLDQAVKVCEKFLPRGQLVVSTEGRNAAQKSEYKATGRSARLKLPIVVLVNGGSASASEIVAGCLQDTQRAFVMGEQSFGKGSVQSILPLQEGAALRLTTAKYYTPSHKVIHEKGITPDSIVPMSEEDELSIALQRSPGGLESVEEKDRERVRNVKDVQLLRAYDYLKGISLYLSNQGSSQKVVSR
ncbi:MAG TPA: S41 family peptidase [Roseimicrobium sp.]|nr:S41 family peptidase [Roseimicrobium sp.]